MFKIVDKPTRRCRVNVTVPEDLGKSTRADFVIDFRVLTKTQIDAIDQAILEDARRVRKEAEAGAPVEMPDHTARVIEENAVDWEGVMDGEGKEIPFSKDALARVMDIPYVRDAVADTFRRNIMQREAARKN